MSGGAQPDLSSGGAISAAGNALSSGTAGTAGGAASAALQNIPQWQKGLLGVMTGDASYGKSAPAMHQLFTKGIGMMMGPQGSAQMPPQMMGGGPPGPIPQSPGIGGQRPMLPGMQGLGQPQMGMPQMSPQMLQQLSAQYPQLFGQRPPGY